MQMNFVSFADFNGTLEPHGQAFVLKLSTIEGKSDANYLTRAVNTLLNFGAIDFVPELGGREYDNLRPFVAGVDNYALLRTTAESLHRALQTLGAVQAYNEWMGLLDKRDTSKRKEKINPQTTFLFGEIDMLTRRHESAFVTIESERCVPSQGLVTFGLGKI